MLLNETYVSFNSIMIYLFGIYSNQGKTGKTAIMIIIVKIDKGRAACWTG